LAVMQIGVYSGAILVLFVFVIALLSSGVKPFDIGPDRMPRILVPAAIVGAIGLIVVIVAGLHIALAPATPAGLPGDAGVFGSVADFGNALFLRNLLPFEVTAFILMVAIIGVVLLAGDDTPGRRRHAAPKRNPSARQREPIAK
jgi:NADH-quinone oxidoreductase subunit J